MISLFRTYNPFHLIWLAVLLVLLRLGYVYHAPDKIAFTFVEPFARLLFPSVSEYALSPGFNIFLAGMLVFIQAIMVNHLCNHYNVLGKPTFLPALMYVIATSLFTPFLLLSSPLICNFLVIAMLYKLFGIYKGGDVQATSYDLGMLVAIGTLIYFPFIYFILIVWISLVIFKPFNWREWMAGVMGYATIFFFLAVFYYLTDRINQFYAIWLPLTTKFPDRISFNYYNYLVLVPVIIILFLCLIKLRQNFFRSYVQIRKTFQLLFIMFIVGGFSFYVRSQFQLNHFLLCAVPAAIFFAYYFLYANARWFYESLFCLLLVGIVYFQFNTF